MSEQESHPEPVLKVSDRRHFTESGERRPGVGGEGVRGADRSGGARAPGGAPAGARGRPAAAPATAPGGARDHLAGPVGGPYATCMMQLGADGAGPARAGGPGGGAGDD